MDKVNGTITRNAKNNHSLILLFILSGLIIPLNSFADEIFWGELTGGKFDFSARYRYEHVDDNIASDQADATGRPNAKTNFAVVADPSETDFLEGYISFAGLPNTTAKAGRQIITYRKAPFHRYMGTVLWRQNWQNHDAFSIQNKSLPDTTINYAYS